MHRPPSPATGVWLFPDRPAPVLVDAAVHAERRGIDEWWLGDEGPAREPFAVLAAVAVRTERLGLAVGITNPYLRHPGLTASTALTVHELSGGRLTLGIGAGGALSLDPFELRADRPLAAVERAIRIARAVAAGSPTEGYRPPELRISADDVAGPMPVVVGARGERLNRLASRVADGAFVAGLAPPRFDEVIGWARSERPIRITLYPSVAFTADQAEAARPQMVWALLNAPDSTRTELGLDPAAVARATDALRDGDDGPARRVVTDEVLERFLLVGPPAVVGARLAELVERHGPDSIGLALPAGDPLAATDAAADAFAAMHSLLAGDPAGPDPAGPDPAGPDRAGGPHGGPGGGAPHDDRGRP